MFIYVTAGDAGQTNGWWEAREQGALAAVREALPSAPMTISIASFNGHPVLRYTCRNSVSYFFRLPDGGPDGNGFPAYHDQSLSQLRDSGEPTTAVDGSTRYNSWKDLWQTLKAAIDFEATDMQLQFTPVVNAADYNSVDLSDQECEAHSQGKCDPSEHPDHKATADALRNFVSEKHDRVWWVSYDTGSIAGSRSGAAVSISMKQLPVVEAGLRPRVVNSGSAGFILHNCISRFLTWPNSAHQPLARGCEARTVLCRTNVHAHT